MSKDHFRVDDILPEFQESVKIIKQTQHWTAAMVHHLSIMVREKDSGVHSTKRMKKQAKSPSPVAPPNELERIARTCEQYSQHYFDSEYYRILNMTSTVCAALGKSEKHMQKEAFEKTIMPIRVWAEEDYPRLIRELQLCTKLHKEMESASRHAQKSPVKQQKADAAREHFNRQYEICKSEIARMSRVHKHHGTCLKQLIQLQHDYFKIAEDELQKASAQARLALQAIDVSAKGGRKRKEGTDRTRGSAEPSTAGR